MGVARVEDAMDIGDGTIPDTDDDMTPPGRAAVSYSTAGDSLFSPATPAPPSSQPLPPQPPKLAQTPCAGAIAEDADDAFAEGLLGLLGDPSGALGANSGALLVQLETMAAEFERQSGEPETEIRAKIALLKSVLDARPGVVAQSRARVDAAVAALESEATPALTATAALGGSGALGAAEAAVHSVCASTVDSIEGGLGKVEATLQADPATAALVSSMLSSSK